MKLTNVIAVAALAALLVAPATVFAQRGGGGGAGGAGGAGGGQRGGMMMQGGMMGGGQSYGMLVGRTDVQKDLKLTADQKTKLTALQEEQQAAMRDRMSNLGGGGGGNIDRDAMRAEMEKAQKAYDEKVMAVLTAEQQKRIKEIRVQLAGNRAVLMEDVQKELGITADQKTKLQALQTKQQEANQALMEEMRGGNVTREEWVEMQAKNEEIMKTEIDKILTAEQKTKFTAMQGAKFTAEEQPRGGFGGRGGGGAGRGGSGGGGGGRGTGGGGGL